ncbi:MAG: hypothetical protein JNJ84_08235 [Rhodobacteraceae bacterium]|nr:hypothetical protein [Paracoccaceae bacterium]
MSALRCHLPALSRFGGLCLAMLVALALLILPPPALRLGGAEQAAVLVQGAAAAAPTRLAAVKAPKAEPETLPPLTLAEAAAGPMRPWAFSRLVSLPPLSNAPQRRAPGQGARAPPAFSDRSV